MEMIHSTKNGSVYQLDTENCFTLSFKENGYKLSVCSFIALKAKINSVDIVGILLDDCRNNSVEIISMCNNSRLLVLTLDEILELKELLAGTLVMIELNSILHQRLNRVLV